MRVQTTRTDRAPEPYWSSDLITIYQGDCRDLMDFLPSGKKVLLATDPPYGLGLEHDNAHRGRGINFRGSRASDKERKQLAKARDYPPVHGDNEPFCPAHLLHYHKAILWGANNYSSSLPDSPKWLVWDKRVEDRYQNDGADLELAWTRGARTSAAKIFRLLWMGMMKEASAKREAGYHPTQKPTALMRWSFSHFEGVEMVVDPYMGSGSTLVAAQDLGLPAIGVEMSPQYCEIAKDRLRQQRRKRWISGT